MIIILKFIIESKYLLENCSFPVIVSISYQSFFFGFNGLGIFCLLK